MSDAGSRDAEPMATDVAPAAAVAAPAAATPSSASRPPRERPHPPEYYQLPSATSSTLLSKRTPDELAAALALPPEAAGYVAVKGEFRMLPSSTAAAASALPVASPPPKELGIPDPSPSPVSTDSSNVQVEGVEEARKARRTEDAADAASSSCRAHQHGKEGDEFDVEEAAGAKDALQREKGGDENGEGTADASATPAAGEEGAESGGRKNKRKRGQNKAAERSAVFRENAANTSQAEVRLCRATAQGNVCPHGDKCRFSHDVAAFLASRDPLSLMSGPCPIFAKFGSCPSGLMCRWAPDGHDAAHVPPARPTDEAGALIEGPQALELNFPPRALLPELARCGVKGARHDKIFPRTVKLMKESYEPWRKKYDKLREEKQNEKQRLQKEQAQAAAKAEAAAGDSSVAPAVTADGSASSSGTPAITSSTLPPTFAPLTAEEQLEIAQLKASYVLPDTVPRDPLHPDRPFDPFHIVSDTHLDWSSGMLLLDLERKPLDLHNKLVLAPLTTVGNLPFRMICKQLGADVTIGEMALASSIAKGLQSEWALMRRHRLEKCFGVQIAAAFPDQAARACELINQHCNVDFVDLNIGCPIDPVTEKGMGSAMMQRKRMRNLEPILRCMTTMLDCPATLKMRMGWSTLELTANEILPVAHRCGIAAVTVHGRTRQQRYTKAADWSFVQAAARQARDELNNLPVICNGDMFSFEDYNTVTGGDSAVTSVMIARGALIKPWLFTEIREQRHWDISASERLELLRDFVRFGHEHFGTDAKGIESTRRYLLEWLSFLHRYVPVGLLEQPRVGVQQKAPPFIARNDLEQLFASSDSNDWIRISEMLISPVPEGFRFVPKHKSSATDEGKHTVEG